MIIDFLNEYSNIIQIGIGFVALIVTIVISVGIYRLQSRHEKEMEELQRQQRERELEHEAEQFLIDNADEIEYLPLCVIASSIHRLNKHYRKIYTNFCRCSDEVQEKIAQRANLSFYKISNDNWVEEALVELRSDIKEHKLGRDILYDNAKYFNRGFALYGEKKWEEIEYKNLFDRIAHEIKIPFYLQDEKENFSDYVKEYFHFLYSDHKPPIYNHKPIPPIDYLIKEMDFKSEQDESKVCDWVMHMVKTISIVEHNIQYTKKQTKSPKLNSTDAAIETYEDAYYDALRAVYNTYYSC